MTIWSDSDDSSFDEDIHEETNSCLMAHENEITSESSSKFNFDELQKAFYELLDDLKKLGLKNKELKMKNQSLLKEKESISNEDKTLTQENQNLKMEVAKLKLIVEKYTLSLDKL